MIRIRMLAALGAMASVLLFGAVIAHAGWYWNGNVDVEGASLWLNWTVVGDNDGSNNYVADIELALPESQAADAKVLFTDPNETLTIIADPDLNCGWASVTYRVSPLSEEVGKAVKVIVRADRKSIGRARGMLGEDIRVDVKSPGIRCPYLFEPRGPQGDRVSKPLWGGHRKTFKNFAPAESRQGNGQKTEA